MRRVLLLLSIGLAAASDPRAATVPFDVSTGRPMVDLRVNGKGPYRFVLDTGAPGLMVTPSLVDELELEVIGKTRVNSPVGGEPVETRRIRVDSIALGDATVSDVQALEIDMGGATLGMGVVGPAVFRRFGSLKMDFEASSVTIGEDAQPAQVETWIPFGKSAPLLDVPVRIGDLTIDGHIDTGSPGVLAIPSRFEDRLPLTGPARTVGMGRTIDAEFEIRAAPIDVPARVGDAQVPLKEVRLAELPVANLGTAGLRGLVLLVDWEHERFALTGVADPVAQKGGTAPRFGVQAHPAQDGTLQVVGTDPGSPAEAIGLLAGDRVVAINGKSMTELPPTQIRAELAKPGLALTVERDGKTVQLKQAG